MRATRGSSVDVRVIDGVDHSRVVAEEFHKHVNHLNVAVPHRGVQRLAPAVVARPHGGIVEKQQAHHRH